MPLKGSPWGRELTPKEKTKQLLKSKVYWSKYDGKTKGQQEQGKEPRSPDEYYRYIREQEYQKFLEFLKRAVHEGRLVPYLGASSPLEVLTGPMGASETPDAGWVLD